VVNFLVVEIVEIISNGFDSISFTKKELHVEKISGLHLISPQSMRRFL
jgi:hypothetical protein